MDQLRNGAMGVLRNASEFRDPVAPLPLYESPSIIAPSLSMKQREPGDGSVPLVAHRSMQKQRELMDHVSGIGEPFCPEPETDANQAIRLVYMNDKQLPSMELLQCTLMHYVRIHGVVPGCLCVSSELQDDIKRDMEVFFGAVFNGTIPFLSDHEAIRYIPVRFLSEFARDYVIGYSKDCL